jgi:toxin ParE1/3/4
MIQWTDQAAHQLDQAYDYIALSKSEEVAGRVARKIVSAIERLATFPISGRAGRIPGTRELVVPETPFIAAYFLDKSRIVVLAIYHGAQRWPDTL